MGIQGTKVLDISNTKQRVSVSKSTPILSTMAVSAQEIDKAFDVGDFLLRGQQCMELYPDHAEMTQ